MTPRRAAHVGWVILGTVVPPILAGHLPSLVELLCDFGVHTMIRSLGLRDSANDLYDALSLLAP